MAINQPTYKPIIGVGATSEKITNLSLPTINTEVGHSLQDGLKGLVVRSRVPSVLKFSFTSSESGTKYVTINKGAVLFLEGIEFSSKTIFLQSDKVTTVEILELYT